MRAVLMVVADVFREQPLQMPFIHRDDVIQQVTAAALHPPFRHTVLPWTLKRSSDRSHAQGANRRRNLESIFVVSVKDQEPGSRSERECFPQLLNNPKACRLLGDVEMENVPTVVADDEQAVDPTERDRGNCEEVHRRNRFAMIAKESQPSLGRFGISLAPFIQREMVRSERSNPSMSSSPWMRSEPQVGFSRTMRKISS